MHFPLLLAYSFLLFEPEKTITLIVVVPVGVTCVTYIVCVCGFYEGKKNTFHICSKMTPAGDLFLNFKGGKLMFTMTLVYPKLLVFVELVVENERDKI